MKFNNIKETIQNLLIVQGQLMRTWLIDNHCDFSATFAFHVLFSSQTNTVMVATINQRNNTLPLDL